MKVLSSFPSVLYYAKLFLALPEEQIVPPEEQTHVLDFTLLKRINQQLDFGLFGA
jgi:hypothetical protein